MELLDLWGPLVSLARPGLLEPLAMMGEMALLEPRATPDLPD